MVGRRTNVDITATSVETYDAVFSQKMIFRLPIFLVLGLAIFPQLSGATADGGVIVWPDTQAMAEAERLRDQRSDEEVVQGIAISDSQIIKARFGVSSKGNGTVSLPGLTVRVYDYHDDGIIFRGGLLLCEWRQESGQPYLDFVVSGVAERHDEKDAKVIAEVPVRGVFRYVPREKRFFPVSCSPEIDFWSSEL